MFDKIEEVTLRSGKKVYIREQGVVGTRVVHPIHKDITKPLLAKPIGSNIIWKNLLFGGSIKKFLFNSTWAIIIYFVLWAYWHDTREMRIVYEHPACFVERHLQEMGFTSQECIEAERSMNVTSNIKISNLNQLNFTMPYLKEEDDKGS